MICLEVPLLLHRLDLAHLVVGERFKLAINLLEAEKPPRMRDCSKIVNPIAFNLLESLLPCLVGRCCIRERYDLSHKPQPWWHWLQNCIISHMYKAEFCGLILTETI